MTSRCSVDRRRDGRRILRAVATRGDGRARGAVGAKTARAPLIVSGDLHAVGVGRMHLAGEVDLAARPITAVLSGPIGTSIRGFPSVVRGIGATPPAHLDLEEADAPIEEHGFTLADFLPDRIVLRRFRWDVNSQPLDAIGRSSSILRNGHTTTLSPWPNCWRCFCGVPWICSPPSR